MRSRARVSQSFWIGPFRFRLSIPLGRSGQVYGSVGTKTGPTWSSMSVPLGRRRYPPSRGTRGNERREER